MSLEIIQGQIELCNSNVYQNIDMYAAGLTLWEILSRTRPSHIHVGKQGVELS